MEQTFAAAKQLTGGAFSHIAFVIHDMEQAIAAYCSLLGVERPPCKLTGAPEEAQVLYRKSPTPARARQCFFNIGGLRIKLMEPDQNASTWRDTLEQNGQGLHHVGFEIENLDASMAELAALGMPTVQTGFYRGGKYAYVDARDSLGMMLELLETVSPPVLY